MFPRQDNRLFLLVKQFITAIPESVVNQFSTRHPFFSMFIHSFLTFFTKISQFFRMILVCLFAIIQGQIEKPL
jgi:hypothetical protein